MVFFVLLQNFNNIVTVTLIMMKFQLNKFYSDHYFVVFVFRSAQVEVKNKKGNSPMWLAANGGHLQVVELLYKVGADIDSQDNRKVKNY